MTIKNNNICTRKGSGSYTKHEGWAPFSEEGPTTTLVAESYVRDTFSVHNDSSATDTITLASTCESSDNKLPTSMENGEAGSWRRRMRDGVSVMEKPLPLPSGTGELYEWCPRVMLKAQQHIERPERIEVKHEHHNEGKEGTSGSKLTIKLSRSLVEIFIILFCLPLFCLICLLHLLRYPFDSIYYVFRLLRYPFDPIYYVFRGERITVSTHKANQWSVDYQPRWIGQKKVRVKESGFLVVTRRFLIDGNECIDHDVYATNTDGNAVCIVGWGFNLHWALYIQQELDRFLLETTSTANTNPPNDTDDIVAARDITLLQAFGGETIWLNCNDQKFKVAQHPLPGYGPVILKADQVLERPRGYRKVHDEKTNKLSISRGPGWGLFLFFFFIVISPYFGIVAIASFMHVSEFVSDLYYLWLGNTLPIFVFLFCVEALSAIIITVDGNSNEITKDVFGRWRRFKETKCLDLSDVSEFCCERTFRWTKTFFELHAVTENGSVRVPLVPEFSSMKEALWIQQELDHFLRRQRQTNNNKNDGLSELPP